MATSFTILSGITVSSNYSWDTGAPFSSTSSLVSTNVAPVGESIAGYSPGLRVLLKNNSVLTTGLTQVTAVSSLYDWNFGDFYNHKNNNYVTPCSGDISHVYIMPGIYTITLTRYETQYEEFYPNLNDLTLKQIRTIIISEQDSQTATVQEILPTAGLYVVTTPQGTTPHEVQLTARTTKAGSFPIDKIVWDFGDGSPLLTISRYVTSTNIPIIQTNIFNSDPADPRNYDPVHTYQRIYNEYGVFYPSITAYSSSTGSTDSCSTTVGPIALPNLNNLKILKSKSTTSGTFYAIKADNNIAFVKTQLSAVEHPQRIIVAPTNPLRDTKNQIVTYSGNPGNTNYYTVTGITC